MYEFGILHCVRKKLRKWCCETMLWSGGGCVVVVVVGGGGGGGGYCVYQQQTAKLAQLSGVVEWWTDKNKNKRTDSSPQIKSNAMQCVPALPAPCVRAPAESAPEDKKVRRQKCKK
jgi:hypothetical protein